ncbi:MAG: hypothetical protein E6J90_10365 [Deltaproteobacteria bacterium]|nr:MAG: hypothetical protein E6J90_10365 [Deltaproteobacteria bacterium]
MTDPGKGDGGDDAVRTKERAMRAVKQIMIGSCVAGVALALLGSSHPPPHQTATMSWSDAMAHSLRDTHGDITSTLRDPKGTSLGVLVVRTADHAIEWTPASGAPRSILSDSGFGGSLGLQEANELAYATWKPAGETLTDCQAQCDWETEWCCTCDVTNGGNCMTCCQLFPSDRNIKANFEPVHGDDVLDRLATIPITRWNYKADGPDVKHVGPMAQDFHAAFGLGSTDKAISVVDASGIALAAIQSLNRKVEALAAESAELHKENRALRAEIQQLTGRPRPAH